MKTLFISILSLSLLLTSCDKDKSNGLLDDNAKVYVTARNQVAAAPAPTRASGEVTPTLREIVEFTDAFNFCDTPNAEYVGGRASIFDDMRDLTNERFILPPYWAIINGMPAEGFVDRFDQVAVVLNGQVEALDTLGYIPNAVIDKVNKDIHTAFAAENFEECYRILQEDIVVIPITGSAYAALKAQGLQ